METDDAGGPNYSKRRKLGEAESNEVAPAPAPAATEAADPDRAVTERSTRDEEPPPGAGGDEEEGGVDHISDLPDPILGEIISLLPIRRAARTQVLSSRWRHLWLSAPLNLDCRRLPDDRRMRDDVVSRILSTHPGPARRLRLPAYYLEDRAAAVDTWLRSPALDNLQELDFCNVWGYQPRGQPPPLAPPPASAFRFSATLHSFTIGRCRLPDSTVQALHFPQLKQLALERVCISECSLSTLMAGCPALEYLLIFYSFGFSCARINSVSLRSIGVRLHQHRGCHRHQTNEVQFRKLIIEDAPCLERLLCLDLFDGLHVSVISAPKLQTLGYLFNQMDYSSTLTQQLPHDSLTTVVGAVKVLVVSIFLLDLDKTLELMQCFPFLEKLYIKSVSGEKNLWIRQHRYLIKRLDIRLKTVVLESYRGIMAQVNFAKFFVMNAKMLETMIFQVRTEHYYWGFETQQSKKLQLEKRASKDAQFHFIDNRYIRCHSEINHVRYLDLDDPFVCEP